jgi:dihydrofolate reductase
VAEALSLAREPSVSVIGGAEVFALFLPVADRIELTEVHGQIDGDTILPPFDAAHWRETARETHGAENGRPAYSFVTLVRC